MSENRSDELEDLARRVRTLEDRDEIAKVIWNYSFLLDTGRWDEVPAEVYSEDGMDVHAEDTDPPMVTQGRESLKEFFR